MRRAGRAAAEAACNGTAASSSSSSSETESEADVEPESMVAALLTATDRQLEVAEHDISLAKAAISPAAFSVKKEAGASAGSSDGGGQPRPSIVDRLLQLHVSESQREVSWSSHLNPCSNLLTALCKRENPNRLVLTLRPGNEGYSVHLATKEGSEYELLQLPYEEDHFLTCVDNQELPASLLDLFDSLNVDLFDSGCIICEVRDLRRRHQQLSAASSSSGAAASSSTTAAEISHVLLKPTTQSIICDSNLITARNLPPSAAAASGKSNGVGPAASQPSSAWTPEERAALEGQLALRTCEPLCLDPSPVVSLVARKVEVARQKYNTAPLSRAVRKFSQAGINRKRKLERCAAPPAGPARLHDFVTQLNKRKKVSPQETLAKHQQLVRANARKLQQQLSAAAAHNGAIAAAQLQPNPAATDVGKFARAIQRRQEVNDMTPHTVEEYILETGERGAGRVYHTRLTIFQRPANEEYLGELYVERDYKEGDNKGSTCRFTLGTRPHALRYINQFTEIFTEEGRKSVMITHRVPNQPPRVTYTPGMREKMSEREREREVQKQRAAAAALSAQRTANGPTPAGAAQQPQPQQTVLQKKLAVNPSTSAPILQQQLSAPQNGPQTPGAAASASVAAVAQLPQHPLPLRAHPLPPQASTASPSPGVSHPPTILQSQLTIQTGPSPSSTPLLPVTPLTPNAAAAVSATAQASPQSAASRTTTPGLAAPAAGTPQKAAGEGDQQEKAISAIMQSLIQDTAIFDPDANKSQQQQQLTSPVQGSQAALVGGAQLPTRPVPQASLVGAVKVSQPAAAAAQSANAKLLANRVSLQNLLNAQASQQSQQPPQTVTVVAATSAAGAAKGASAMPQLAAQLNRPVNLPPTYTQAVAQAQVQAQAKQTMAGQQRPRLILQQQQQQLIRRQSSSSSDGKVNSLSQDSPGLHSLLANTPSADNPGDGFSNNNSGENSAPATPSGTSILERLVTGQPQPGTSRRRSSDKGSLSQDAPGLHSLLANTPSADNPASAGVDGAAAAAFAPAAEPQPAPGNSLILERLVTGGGASNGTASPLSSPQAAASSGRLSNPPSATTPDSTQEITLATILAKPPLTSSSPAAGAAGASSGPTTPTGLHPSPTGAKASPLLHQLQQPTAANRQLLQAVQNSSPIRQQQASPSRQQVQAAAQSPRVIQPSPSPGRAFSLPQSPGNRSAAGQQQQQQLMQPPGARGQQQQAAPQSILSATLQQQQPQQQQPIVSVASVVQNATMVTLPVQEAVTNGLVNNGSASQQQQQPQAAVQQQPQNVVSLQNLLQQHGMVQVSAAGAPATVQSANNMVQLHVPGLSSPVTLSLANLQGGDGQQVAQGQGVIVAAGGQAAQQVQQQQKQHAALRAGAQQQQVVFQQAANNFIQLPQQPAGNLKPVNAAAGIQQIKGAGGQLLQVRQGASAGVQPAAGQVFLQMPVVSQQGGVIQQPQSIQIVRTMPQATATMVAANAVGQAVVAATGQPQQAAAVGQPQLSVRALPQQPSPQQQQLVQLNNTLKSPQRPSPSPGPQTPGVPPSPSGSSSMTSPQSVMAPPDSPLMPSPAEQLAVQKQLKMTHRTQRKQSLK